ncbi:MAG: AraC family transcriptional regulator [Ekhidna sp.]|nr:AraC family transcriptional regulator [Ekhidna sp.]
MSTPNPVLSTIIIILAIQAMILCGLLVFRKPRNLSNTFLALLVFFFALQALNIAIINVFITLDIFPLFRYIQLEMLYGMGPAIFFYAKSVTDQEFSLRRRDLIHFIPIVLEFIFYRTAFYRLGADGLYQTPHHPYTKIYLTQQWLGILSVSIYCILALSILIKHQNWLKQNYSEIKDKSLGWLKAPIIIYAGYWIGWNLLTEFDKWFFDRALRSYYFLPTFVGLALVSCWIGFLGYTRKVVGTTGYQKIDKDGPEKSIDITQVKKVKSILENEKPFLDPELDLARLSKLTDIPPKKLSSIINQGFSKNFYELINHYRIETFKKNIESDRDHKLTLLGHALDSGFKSKSTFNEVFKKATGYTPSSFQKMVQKKSA